MKSWQKQAKALEKGLLRRGWRVDTWPRGFDRESEDQGDVRTSHRPVRQPQATSAGKGCVHLGFGW